MHPGVVAASPSAQPHIAILATGGTIAGAQASRTQAGYQADQFDVQQLIDAVPQLRELAELSGEQVANCSARSPEQ